MTTRPTTDGAADALAARQNALIAALVERAEVPPGFDAAAVEATRRALRHTRAGDAAKAWPALRRELGDGYHRRFAAYAAETPPPDGGPAADGFCFAAQVRPRPRSDAARVELAAGRVTWTARGGRVRRRRVGVSVTHLAGSRSVVVFVRLPRLGLRRIDVRVPR